MANEHVYRENVPVYIDGVDFGFECTLYRSNNVNYDGLPDWYGHIAFTYEQALAVAQCVNSHNDPNDPMCDYLQGYFGFDPYDDMFIEYYDVDSTEVYDRQPGFDTEDGMHLYAIGSDWCWTLEQVS